MKLHLRLATSLASWLAALCLVATPAWADPPKVKPTADQLRLLDQALRAAQGGKHEEAARLYQQALEIAPLNVAYLGLGRAQQRLGACVPAWRAFQRALDAPVSDDPRTPPDKVREGLTRFLGELRQTCPDKAGDLRVSCSPDDLSLTVDGKPAACGQPLELPSGPHAVVGTRGQRAVSVTATVPPFDLQELRLQLPQAATLTVRCDPSDLWLTVDDKPAACEQPLELDPGPHTLRAQDQGGQRHEQTLDLAQGQALTVSLRLAPPEGPPQGAAPNDTWRTPLGWGLLTFGGLNLGLGLGLSLAVDDINQDLSTQANADLVDGGEVQRLRDDGDSYQTLQFVAYGLGVGSVLGGALLLWAWDELWPVTLAPALSPQGLNLTLGATF